MCHDRLRTPNTSESTLNDSSKVQNDQSANGETNKKTLKKDLLKQLADNVVAEGFLASGRYMAKKEQSVMVKATSVITVIAGIPCLIEYAMTALMTARLYNRKPYSNSIMAAMRHAIVYRTTSAGFEFSDFEIFLQQTLDDILSSSWYLVMVTESSLDTDKVFRAGTLCSQGRGCQSKGCQLVARRTKKTFTWVAKNAISAG